MAIKRSLPLGWRMRLSIALSLRTYGGHALLAVRDNGAGIPAEDLGRVFTAFAVRERQPTHSGAGGLGLGLSLARTLAELHGGALEARSDGPGKGSEFVLRLPLSAVTRS